MTDAEIVKALNEAEDLENVLLYCKNPNKEVMIPIKITDIRDLINRLQVNHSQANNQNSSAGLSISSLLDTINGLTLERSNLIADNNRLQAENERLKEILNTDFIIPLESDDTSSLVIVKIDSIKAEAYKEFAERLKENCKVIGAPLITNRIDNLLKEMVGDGT